MRMLLAVTLPAATLGQRLLVGVPFLALSAIFAYEWLAYTFGWAPTLSKILSYHLTSRGPGLAFVYGMVVGVAFLILFLHFTGLLKWWQP
jgi:hypothetical protein